MRKLFLNSLLIAILLAGFIGCDKPLTVEQSEVISVPSGYKIEAAAVQQSAKGEPKPFLLLKKEGSETDYKLYPSGFGFSAPRTGEYVIGPAEGDFLFWGSDEDLNNKHLIRGTEFIPVPEGVLPVLCPNGRDYAWEERDAANRKIRRLVVNGKAVHEMEKNHSELTFSPDGSRLIYAAVGDYFVIQDAIGEMDQVQMPSQDLDEISFSFGSDNILKIHYQYEEFSGIRDENSFVPFETYYNDKELWFTQLVRRSELFYSTRNGTGMLLGGDEAKLPNRMTDYNVSPDCSRLLTFGFKHLSSSKESGGSPIPLIGIGTQNHNLKLQISENGKQIVGEKVTLTKLSGGINAALPANSLQLGNLRRPGTHRRS